MGRLMVVGKALPGVSVRTTAFIAAFLSVALSLILLITVILSMVFTYREEVGKEARREEAEKQMVQCYYGVGFAIWGCWILMCVILIAGIQNENKRALGVWLIYILFIPLYFLIGIIFFAVTKLFDGWAIAYICIQGGSLIALIWCAVAIYFYFCEVRKRDKNPNLRVEEFIQKKETEQMFFPGGPVPPYSAYNPGYPGGGSMNSIPRSTRSRHTYAPTEVESTRTGPSVPRQSRLEQYQAQHPERGPLNPPNRSPEPEREGGTTYYKYQYVSEQRQETQQRLHYEADIQQVSKDSEV